MPENQQPSNISDILKAAERQLNRVGIDSARLDSEVLLSHVLGCDRAYLLVHGEKKINADQWSVFQKLVARREKHEPVAYLIGHKEFMGLDFLVTPDVLIPRPETEIIVETAINLAGKMQQPKILDIGCGSGCIVISLAKHIQTVKCYTTDISQRAITIAQQNETRILGNNQIQFIEKDLFPEISELETKFDIIVSNPPYITESELASLASDIRDYEPQRALNGGVDGLTIIRKIIKEAPRYLNNDGYLILEIGDKQAPAVRKLVEETGRFAVQSTQFISDLAGKERILITKKYDSNG
ncbi:MAG: peptide chain release factor N(5)-glutamine methyltransferase [bacterium]